MGEKEKERMEGGVRRRKGRGREGGGVRKGGRGLGGLEEGVCIVWVSGVGGRCVYVRMCVSFLPLFLFLF